MQVICDKVIDAVTADTTKCIKVDKYSQIFVLVDYTRSGSAEGTITFYSSIDDKGLVKAACGIKPVLTGTVDADGAVAYTTSTAVWYEIVGVHKYLYIDWNETVDGSTISVYVVGKQEQK